MNDKSCMIGILIITIITIGVIVFLCTKKKEKFYTISYQGSPILTFPVFLNLYPDNLSMNPSRFEFSQKLKFLTSVKDGTLRNLYNYPYNNITTGHLDNVKNTSPVILIPGLGCSNIKAKWENVSSRGFYTPTPDDKYLDTQDAFSCKATQHNYQTLWYDCPMTKDKYGKYCWGDLLKVYSRDKQIVNNSTVETYVPTDQHLNANLSANKYFSHLIETFVSAGYVPGVNLFVANYDFRKIGDPITTKNYMLYLKDLIETLNYRQCKATVIAHDLGTSLFNMFLNSTALDNQWKEDNIKDVVYIAPTIGGCPKALRVYLSGESWFDDPDLNRIFKETTRNFSGLLYMLPYTELYTDKVLVTHTAFGAKYESKDIQSLMTNINDSNGAAIYENNVLPYLKSITQYPNVPCTIIKGDGQYTESTYTYNHDLETNPIKVSPDNKLNNFYNQQTRFPSFYQGDGTMPNFVIDNLVKKWNAVAGTNKLDVKNFNMEHTALTQSKPVLQLCLSIAQNEST